MIFLRNARRTNSISRSADTIEKALNPPILTSNFRLHASLFTMTLHLFNTLSGQLDELAPMDGAELRMYACGPYGLRLWA